MSGWEPPSAVMALLAAGRIEEALDAIAAGGEEPWTAIARADARVRVFDITLAELDELRTRVADGRGPGELALLWVQAVIGEHLVTAFDDGATAVAEAALAACPDAVLPGRSLLWIRGRLRRVAAMRSTAHPGPDGQRRALRLRAQAVDDFLRADLPDEALMTAAFGAAFEVITIGEDALGNLARLLDVRAQLDDPRSIYPAIIDRAIALVASSAGAAAVAVPVGGPAAAPPGRFPGLDRFLALCDTLAALGGPPAAKAPDEVLTLVDDAVGRIGPRNLRWRWLAQANAADRLLDADHPEAGRFGDAVRDASMLGSRGDADRSLLGLRLRVHANDLPTEAELVATLEAYREAVGVTESTHETVRRLARELDRRGAGPAAARLAAWLDEHPPEAQWKVGPMPVPPAAPAPRVPPLPPVPLVPPVPGEPSAARRGAPGRGPVDRPGPGTAPFGRGPAAGPATTPDATPAPPVVIGVLTPTLEVAVDGDPVAVADLAALLVTQLAAAHPAPVHVEQLADSLWPGCSPAQARKRLNGIMYRLRERWPRLAAATVRTHDVLRLDPQRCAVDLADHRRAVATEDPDAAVAALAAVRGNLCQVQFPYDERLIDARRRFAAEWTRHAVEAVAARPAALARLAPAAAALEVDLDEIVGGGAR